ncbi:MAG TPA: polysaccharide biosynthesis C-terminal domain-containing protein [Vitreimonas sp.]|uniref:lipopolysaccharide biosynthesis protein n=1 Tax=Vitreimonas sp. TaxID=3069702 RepID=UPI002D655ADC|nr:polysaccharide biosynthesis C-terminal domain-containing protein [Vitreimonas sp.]HYD86887.1 polysaccharide biosynthesis C-terminal domain-containing protein [Vitreimonas sp.]
MTAGRLLTLAPLQLVQALVGFGGLAAFTRLMSAEEFGRYALALSLSLAAHTLLFTWAEAAAFRFFATAQAGRRLADHFATVIAIALALGLATMLATGLVLTRAGLGAEVNTLAAFAAGASVLRFVTRIGRESDRAALAFTRYAGLEIAYLALGFAAGLAFLTVFDLGAAAPFAGLALGGAIVALFDAPRLYAQAKDGYATFSRSRHYAAYGGPLALALVVDLAVQAGARIIVATQAGEASLGAYAAAFGLARPLDLLFIGVSAAYAPVIFQAYERDAETARTAARTAFAILVALTLPACVGLALVAEPLSALMLGESVRAEAAQALPWLALAGLFSGFTLYYWSEAFQLTQRTGLRALLMLAPGAVQLTATYALTPAHGAIGAALAAAAGAVVGCALLSVVGRGLFALPAPREALLRAFAATTLMAGAVWLTPDYAGLAAKVAVGAASYALAALALDLAGARGAASAVLQSLSHTMRGLRPALLDQTK